VRLLYAYLFVLACFLGPICSAQDVYNEINVGTPPNGLFHGGEIDTVQLNNGNLHIEIPLWSVKGRGPLAPGAIFVLDSKEWTSKITIDKTTGDPIAHIQTEVAGTFGGVWRGLNYVHFSQTYHAANLPNCVAYSSNRVIGEANGTKHHLVPDPGNNCPAILSWPLYYADDGSGLIYGSSGVLNKDGIAVGSIDTNGNSLGSSTDTLGRSLADNGSLTYYDNAGNPQTIQITTTLVPVNTHLCQYVTESYSICYEQTGTRGEVSQIKLANGMTYTINYIQNDEGEPSSITLRSGAQISWTYNVGDSGGPTVATRTVVANGQSSTWTYGSVNCGIGCVSIVDPLGNETDSTFTSVARYPGNPYNGMVGGLSFVTTKQIKDKSSGSLVFVKTETTDYSNSIGPVLPIRVTSTWSQTNQVSKVETDYDSFTNSNISGFTFSATNPVAKREYDWASGAPGNLLRRTAFNYLHLSNSSYLTANILDRATSKAVYDSTANTCKGLSQACAQATYSYDSTAITSTSGTPAPNHDYTGHGYTFTVRGNLTQTSRWLNSSGTWLNTTSTYDDLGNLRSTTDPNGNVTSYSYTDNFTDGINRNAQAFVTQVTHPVTSGVNHIEKKQFFWYTSLVAASCGQNFSSACANTFSPPQPDFVKLTYDNMFRPLTITHGDGGSTTASYNDLTLPLSMTATASITSSLNKVNTALFDDLYRLKQTQLTSDQQGTVFTDTTYDALGRKSTVTNPHRTASAPTNGTTTSYYDALGRRCLLVPPDGTGSGCPSTRPSGDVLTSYSGNTVTVTDQAGKSRKSVSDGLGRLTQVFEDPAGLNYETDYQYDALDNLTRDDQKGGDPNSGNWRTRTFAYDSLSRLLCAANPEIQIVTCPNPDSGSYTAGTARYTYDSDSNVLTKKSPKPYQTSGSVTVTATYAYDALNRPKSKSFDNGDPTINYAYDAVAPTGCTPGSFTYGNAIGKRTAMCDAAGMELWGYSITPGVGWLTTDQRTTNSVTKTTSYQGNFGGVLASLTYPSGRVVTYTPDGAGRTSKAVDVPNSINYVIGTCPNGTDNLGACYTPPGSVSSFSNGASAVSTFYYNDRLQPCRISVKSSGTAPASCTDTALGNVLDFAYNFSLGSSDNGNVVKITNNRDTTRSINYGYDSLNRIAYAYTDGNLWGETYQIDAWGNLNKILPYTGKPQSENLNQMAGANNQFTGMSYDAAGNLLNDGASSYVYDGENRIITGAGVTYTYDGDGKRVKKSNGKLYWYGTGSDPLDETDLAGNTNNSTFNEYIFFNGQRIARRDYSGNIFYYFADHLGTSRVMFQSGQTLPCYDADFYPYGKERTPILNSCSQNCKFTGKERDTESGLDNFGARYMGSNLGRFMSPDPKQFSLRTLSNPQKWNKYPYVLNNPLALFDPDGLEEFTVTIRRFISAPVSAPGALGDNRKAGQQGTFRFEQKVTIETDSKKNGGNPQVSSAHTAGTSVGVSTNPNSNVTPMNLLPVDVGVGTANMSNVKEEASRNNRGNVVTTFEADVKYPNTPEALTPSITHDLVVVASPGKDGSTTFSIAGNYSDYPGLEVEVQQSGSSSSTLLYGDNADSITGTILGALNLLCPDAVCGQSVPANQPGVTIPASAEKPKPQ
jgi:RHS repeat-associated protein